MPSAVFDLERMARDEPDILADRVVGNDKIVIFHAKLKTCPSPELIWHVNFSDACIIFPDRNYSH